MSLGRHTHIKNLTSMALGQTCCNRNHNGMEPSHLKDIQYNVNVWELSWNIKYTPKWKKNTQEQQNKFRCKWWVGDIFTSKLHNLQFLSATFTRTPQKLHSSCYQHLQEHHKTCTVLASNIYKNTTKLAQFLSAAFTGTQQNLHSSCQQPLQEHKKICTILVSSLYNTTKLAQFLSAAFTRTQQNLHSYCQQPLQEHNKTCTVLPSNH